MDDSFLDALREPPRPRPVPGGPAVSTYVSLFLLLFVFFIVLFTIADREHPHGGEVVQSIDRAFAGLPSALGILPKATPLTPEMATPESFARDVNLLFTGFAPLHEAPEAAPGGTFLEVALDPASLFAANSAQPKPEAKPLLDRLALLLGRRPDGKLFRLTWRAVVPAEDRSAQDLAAQRGAAVLARLYGQGAPADALAVQLDPGKVAAIRLDFTYLDTPSADSSTGEP